MVLVTSKLLNSSSYSLICSYIICISRVTSLLMLAGGISALNIWDFVALVTAVSKSISSCIFTGTMALSSPDVIARVMMFSSTVT